MSGNAKDFSTRDNEKSSSASLAVVLLGALAVVGLLAFLFKDMLRSKA